MDWRHLVLGSLTLAVLGNPADAGIFNRNKSKDSPKQEQTPAPGDHIGELVKVLRTSSDERRRSAAADELSKADLRQHPQAGEALIASLQQDPSPAVRADIAMAIGRLRPLTLQGGQALEEAINGDSSPRVRQFAKAAIGAYLQAGYRAGGADPKSVAQVPPPAAQRPPAPRPTPPLPQRPVGRQTGEPPLAAANPTPKPRQDQAPTVELKTEPGPAPTAPRLFAPVKETKPDVSKPAKTDEEGPILTGPG